jgi:lipopolysaccharide biosynthesis regulator YciM
MMEYTPYITLIIIAVVGLYFVFGYKPRKKTNIRDIYSEGLDLLVNGHLKSAYQNFKMIVQKDTGNINAYLKLGQVAREGGNPEQALRIHKGLSMRKKITVYQRLELHKNLAMDYYELGNIQDAIVEVLYVLNHEKKNEWALTHLVKYYQEEGDWGKAGEYLVKYQKSTEKIDLKKVALYKIQEGRILLKKEEFISSRTIFEDALKIYNNVPVAYNFIGNSFASESEIAYTKASGIDEQTYQTSDEKEKYKNQLGNAKELLAKAIPMWLKYAELESKQAWIVIPKLKDALFALERFDEVEGFLRQILRNDPNNVDALSSLADFYHHKGDVQESIELIEYACDRDKDSLIAKLIRMKLRMRTEDKRNLTADLDKIIEEISTKEVCHNKMKDESDISWLLEKSGDLDKISS